MNFKTLVVAALGSLLMWAIILEAAWLVARILTT